MLRSLPHTPPSAHHPEEMWRTGHKWLAYEINDDPSKFDILTDCGFMTAVAEVLAIREGVTPTVDLAAHDPCRGMVQECCAQVHTRARHFCIGPNFEKHRCNHDQLWV